MSNTNLSLFGYVQFVLQMKKIYIRKEIAPTTAFRHRSCNSSYTFTSYQNHLDNKFHKFN